MSTDGELLDNIVSEVARVHGVVVKRDDPIMAMVLANKTILHQYLTLAVAPITRALEETATQARHAISDAAIETRQAIADAVPRAQQELTAHVHAQTHYVEQQLLKDREKFVNAQKALLEDFEERLLQRDAALTKIVAETFNKAGKQLAVELTDKGLDKKSMARWQKKQDRQGLLGLFIGLAGGSMATLGGLWLAARYTQ